MAAGAIRQHWGIENQLHWVLDVVFREDELSLNDPDGAAHMALLNRVALGVIKQHTGLKDSVASKRRRAAWSADFRSELVFGKIMLKVDSRPGMRGDLILICRKSSTYSTKPLKSLSIG